MFSTNQALVAKITERRQQKVAARYKYKLTSTNSRHEIRTERVDVLVESVIASFLADAGTITFSRLDAMDLFKANFELSANSVEDLARLNDDFMDLSNKLALLESSKAQSNLTQMLFKFDRLATFLKRLAQLVEDQPNAEATLRTLANQLNDGLLLLEKNCEEWSFHESLSCQSPNQTASDAQQSKGSQSTGSPTVAPSEGPSRLSHRERVKVKRR